MDIQAYLKRQRSRLQQQSEQVKDYRVFDFAYVPAEPMIRPETKPILDALLRFDLTGVPTNLLVLGSRGSGKTLTMKHLSHLLPKQTSLRMHYVNCRHHNTSHRILAELLGGRSQGLSLGALYQKFIGAHAGQRLCLVLDEVDLMSPKDRRREVLYLLSRAETPVMLILLSNNHRVADQLDAATRSSLQLSTMLFRSYNPAQIESILAARAEEGLSAWEPKTLTEIAARTVRHTHADARVAIKTLFYLVTRSYLAESSSASDPRKSENSRSSADQALPRPPLPGGVEAAFEFARRDIVLDMINDLNDGLLLILWAVVTGESRLAKDIFERYGRFCRERHESPFSYVHYYASLAYLQSCGLVALISTKLGRAYTNRVEATFDPTIVEPIVNLRFT
jgi:Cdc6-like AAA superfamily ATPase